MLFKSDLRLSPAGESMRLLISFFVVQLAILIVLSAIVSIIPRYVFLEILRWSNRH